MRKYKNNTLISIAALGLAMLISLYALFFFKSNRVNPPFYRVTDESTGGVVYMLGTIHVGLNYTHYPQNIYKALNESDTLAVELDLQRLDDDYAEIMNEMKIFIFNEGNAQSYLGEDYEELKSAMESYGVYFSGLDVYVPYIWTSQYLGKITAECGYESKYGTDRAMLTYAKEHSKNIYEIETVGQQYAVNAGASKELQIYMLKEALNDHDGQVEYMHMLYKAWKKGDSNVLSGLLDDGGTPDDLINDYMEYYDNMYTHRQEKMADYVINCLKKGEKTFVAVGALHYFAEPDIIDYVEQAGYTVEQIGGK